MSAKPQVFLSYMLMIHILGGLRGYIPRSKFSNNPFSLKVDAPKNNSVLYVEDHLANHDWSETAVITKLKLL